MADSISNVGFLQDNYFKKELRSHRGNHIFLMTGNLKIASIKKLCVVLETSKIHLLKFNKYFELIDFTGCYKIVTPHLTDFASGYLTRLEKPMAMYGIAGLLVANQKGWSQYEVINYAGVLSILDCEDNFLTYLKVCLFSPQLFIQYLQERSKTYTLTWDGSVHISKTDIVYIYDIIDRPHSQSYEPSMMP